MSSPACHTPTMKNEIELDELDGYCELGMTKEAVALCRKILRRKAICSFEFEAAVITLLIQTNHPKRWRLCLESAFARLPLNARPHVKIHLFRFYVTIEDWKAALACMPKRPEHCTDLLLCMWTFLNLRQLDDAKRIYRECRCYYRKDNLDETDKSSVGEAMACYLAQIGEWPSAARIWIANAKLEPFDSYAREGIIQLFALKALMQVNEASASLHEDSGGTEIILPGNERALRGSLRKKYSRYAKHLTKIIPPKDWWRFGR